MELNFSSAYQLSVDYYSNFNLNTFVVQWLVFHVLYISTKYHCCGIIHFKRKITIYKLQMTINKFSWLCFCFVLTVNYLLFLFFLIDKQFRCLEIGCKWNTTRGTEKSWGISRYLFIACCYSKLKNKSVKLIILFVYKLQKMMN